MMDNQTGGHLTSPNKQKHTHITFIFYLFVYFYRSASMDMFGSPSMDFKQTIYQILFEGKVCSS